MKGWRSGAPSAALGQADVETVPRGRLQAGRNSRRPPSLQAKAPATVGWV
jgi:hypothetical protein